MSIARTTAAIVAACVRRPWLVIVLAALLGGAAATYVASHIAIDADTTKLIDERLPWRQRERALDAAFHHRTDMIVVVVDGATAELAEDASARLAARLASGSSTYRAVWRPDGGPFFEQEGLLFQSTADVARTTQQMIAAQPLLGTLAQDPTLRGLMDALMLMSQAGQYDEAAWSAIAEPLNKLAVVFAAVAAGQVPAFSWRALITGSPPAPRERRRFILVEPVLDYRALRPGEAATQAIRKAAHELGLDADGRVRVRLTGRVPLADEEFGTLAEGAAINTSVMLLAIVVLLWLALRSLRMVAATFLTLAVGLIVTAAVGLLAFGAFNLISVAFAVLFVGLGVDFCIQFCVCYRARRHATADLMLALREAGGEIGAALALAAASTAAGFYAFLPTEYRGVSELGAIAGTGMIVAVIASITVLPALLAVFRAPGEAGEVGYAAMAPLDRALLAHRRVVLAVSAVAALAAMAFLPRLQFDFNPLHLRSASAESVSTLLDLMQDRETAPDSIEIVEPSLDAAIAMIQRLEQLPEVDHAISLASFVPEQQAAKLPLIEDAALLLSPVLEPGRVRPPPSDEETARSMTTASMRLTEAAAAHPGIAESAARLGQALRTLAEGQAADRERARAALIPSLSTTLAQLRAAMQAHPVTVADLPDEVKRDWIAADGRARVEVFPKGDAADNETLRRFVAAVTAVAPNATGAPVGIQESGRTIVRAFLQAGVWSLVAIVLLLAFTLRRATDVALTLAPLALSALLTLGISGAFGMALNFENIIALPLLLGIGVAFNIYFVSAWRAGRGKLLQSSLARAVIFSALTTGTAFGSLWLSHHPGTASMGKLLALSLACTLVATLLFLPALLGPPRRTSVDAKADAAHAIGPGQH